MLRLNEIQEPIWLVFFLLGFPAGWRYQIYAGQFRPPGIKALTAGSTTVFLSQPANIATREIGFHEDGWNGMGQMFPRRKFVRTKSGGNDIGNDDAKL